MEYGDSPPDGVVSARILSRLALSSLVRRALLAPTPISPPRHPPPPTVNPLLHTMGHPSPERARGPRQGEVDRGERAAGTAGTRREGQGRGQGARAGRGGGGGGGGGGRTAAAPGRPRGPPSPAAWPPPSPAPLWGPESGPWGEASPPPHRGNSLGPRLGLRGSRFRGVTESALGGGGRRGPTLRH